MFLLHSLPFTGLQRPACNLAQASGTRNQASGNATFRATCDLRFTPPLHPHTLYKTTCSSLPYIARMKKRKRLMRGAICDLQRVLVVDVHCDRPEEEVPHSALHLGLRTHHPATALHSERPPSLSHCMTPYSDTSPRSDGTFGRGTDVPGTGI